MNEKIRITQKIAEHKERHPRDKNIRKKNHGVVYSKNIDAPAIDIKILRKLMMEHNRVIYKDLEIGHECPKCDGKVIWFGTTKHNPDHFRCNKGCVL